MPFYTHKNGKTYYEVSGSGNEHMVFAHSMLFNLRMFDDQIKALCSSFKCLAYDFKGQGKSSVEEVGYELDDLVEETADLLKNKKFTPCHFVGFSMGGMVGMKLAIKYPELIKSLILIDTSSESEPKMHRPRNLAMLYIGRYLGLKLLSSKVISMFFGTSFLKDNSRKQQRIYWKNQFINNSKIGMFKAAYAIVSRKSFTQTIDQITCPTLILVGEDDQLTPLKKAQILHERIQDSILKVIPRAGHMSTVEEPEYVNDAISAFIGVQTA